MASARSIASATVSEGLTRSLPTFATAKRLDVSHMLPKRVLWEARLVGMSVKSLKSLARPKRFELLTPKFVVRGTCAPQSAMITL